MSSRMEKELFSLPLVGEEADVLELLRKLRMLVRGLKDIVLTLTQISKFARLIKKFNPQPYGIQSHTARSSPVRTSIPKVEGIISCHSEGAQRPKNLMEF